MGLLDGLLGNASEVAAASLQTEFAQVLAPDERIEKAYQLIRDMFVFTDKRRTSPLHAAASFASASKRLGPSISMLS